MADFEKMIPFILHFAAGVYGKDGSDLTLPLHRQFELARKSGWSDDPDDPGGATMIDVTLSTFRTYRKMIGKPVPSESDLHEIEFHEWKEILKRMFWDRCRADEIESQAVANIVVDWVCASGPKTIRNVQRILQVKTDGIVGPRTIHTINMADSEALFKTLHDARARYYRNCRGAWKYLSGWMRRLDAILPDGTFLIRGHII